MATIVVTSNANSGAGSLRAAVAAARNGDTVDMTGRRGTIKLTSPIDIACDLTLTGPGSDQLILSGNDATVGLRVNSPTRLSISDLSLAHFKSTDTTSGGAAIVQSSSGGQVSLSRVVLRNNTSAALGGAMLLARGNSLVMSDCVVSANTSAGGGAMMVAGGPCDIVNSTFSYNIANAYDGSAAGAALVLGPSSQARIANSTFSDNKISAGNAAGIAIRAFVVKSLQMVNCTVANNTATGDVQGGGISVYADTASLLSFTNCVIAANTPGSSSGDLHRDSMSTGPITVSHSLIGDGRGSGQTDGANGNRVGTAANRIDPGLQALASNGGFGQTLALAPTSPARDAGTDAATGVRPTDQRGVPRTGTTDMGAFEWAPTVPAFTTTPPATAITGQAYEYRADASDLDGDALTYDAVNLPAWLSRSGSALTGTPAEADEGVYAITVRVSDGTNTVEQTFSLTVADAPPPAFTSAATGRATTGLPFVHAIGTTATGPSVITADGLPDWLKLIDNGNGTASLQGTPGDQHAGHTTVRLTINDGTFSGTTDVDVEVAAEPIYLDSTGLLHVNGTDGNDAINVWLRDRGRQLRVTMGDRLRNFRPASVKAIQLTGYSGNDVLVVNAGTRAAFLYGGDGDDTLTGGGGADRLYGDAGQDKLFGGDADDRLYGGDGRDTLDGQAGRDTLYGEAASDVFYAIDNARDRLFGGRAFDNDKAYVDGRLDLLDGIKFVLA